MDDRRWENLTRARTAYAKAEPDTTGLPVQAQIEISARCNLRCTMCAIGYDTRYAGTSGRPSILAPELFSKLRPIFPSLLEAHLFGLGEPLLHPHLVTYVREMALAGVRITFHTNATLLDDRKADALARAGVAHTTVSIDGATASTYEAIRRGGRFADALRGIRALLRASRRYGRPTVDLAIVAMKSNLEEIPRLVDLGAELGVRGIHVEPLLRQVGSPELDEHYARENLAAAGADRAALVFEDAIARAGRNGVAFSSRFTSERTNYDYSRVDWKNQASWLCSEPWATVFITVAGEVRTCCLNDLSFGNLFEKSFEEIWFGDPYVRFRDQHAKRSAPGCANCVQNGRVRSSPWFRPTESVSLRPMADSLPASDDSIELDSPCEGGSVTAPFVVVGRTRMHRRERRSSVVMIDHTPVEFLSNATFADESFRLTLPTDAFLTDGAHLLWVRNGDRALARREFHYRRI